MRNCRIMSDFATIKHLQHGYQLISTDREFSATNWSLSFCKTVKITDDAGFFNILFSGSQHDYKVKWHEILNHGISWKLSRNIWKKYSVFRHLIILSLLPKPEIQMAASQSKNKKQTGLNKDFRLLFEVCCVYRQLDSLRTFHTVSCI